MGIRDWFRSPTPASRQARFGYTRPAATTVVAGRSSSGTPDAPAASPRERWQDDIWPMYEQVGEFHQAVGYAASCLSRTRIVAGIIGDDDQPGPLYDDDGNVVEGVAPEVADLASRVLDALKPPVGGQARLLFAAGLNLGTVGECWLVGNDTLGLAGEVVARSFEVCSREEIIPGSTVRAADGRMVQGWRRRYAPNSQPVDLPPETFLLRIHKPHPQFALLADAPARALGPVLERMRLLTLAGQAEATSRLAGNGVWMISEDVDWPEDDTDDGTHPLQRQLIAAMGIAIRDPGSAAAYTPYVIEMPEKAIETSKYQRFDRPDTFDVDKKRLAAVDEFARGTNLPLEAITGMSGLSGLGGGNVAEAIDEATYKAHIEPDLDLICEVLTAGYLRPQLLAAMPGLDVSRLVFYGDPADLVIHPDKGQAADRGYGTAASPVLAISEAAWRRAHGFGQGDAPDEEEVEQRITVARRVAFITALPDGSQLAPAGQEVVAEEGTTEAPAPSPAPPALAPVPEPVAAAGVPAMDALVLLAATRAAEKVWNKSKARAGKAGHAHLLNGSPAAATTSILAAAGVPWQVEPVDLPPDEFASLATVARAVAEQAGHPDPDGAARSAVSDAGALTWTLTRNPG